MKQSALISIALSTLILASGCGRKPEEKMIEKAIEKQTGGNASVNLSQDSISIQTQEGSFQMTSGESAKIPADFPSDVYIHKSAKLQTVMHTGEGSVLSFHTEDSPEKISEKYQSEMKNNGWARESIMDMGEQLFILFKKNERVATVIISRDDQGTLIAMTVVNQ